MVHAMETEEQAYWDKWTENRDSTAGEHLLQLYTPLVNYHVQRIAVGLPRNIDSDVLRSHGLLGLFDALNKFDISRDLKFDTYASFRIRGAILDGLRKEDWMPRTLRDKTRKIESAIDTLQQKHLRNVTAKEVAEEIGIDEEEITAVQAESYFANLMSTDDEYDNEDGHMNLSIEDKNMDTPEDELFKEETVRQLADMIHMLNEKEQLVISLFYYEDLTLTEIGKVLDLSTSRISQIHSKALFRLKQVFSYSKEARSDWLEER